MNDNIKNGSKKTAIFFSAIILMTSLLSTTISAAKPAVKSTEEAVKKVATAKPSPPNIVFILTDDQRFDALGCMGNKTIQTPNIDAMAKEGVIFDQMFCTTSICAISRASFLLGQYERKHQIAGFRTPCSKQQLQNSFPIQLRKAGYRTGLVGKWGLGGKPPKDQFDYWAGFKGQNRYYPKGEEQTAQHLTETITQQSLKFLDDCSPQNPFLLQVYTKAPHCQDRNPRPFPSARKYAPLYKDTAIPVPCNATEKSFQKLPELIQTSEARIRWNVRFATPELHQESVKDYYRLIAGIDELVGRVRKKLIEKGVSENTVIIYTSDNGFYLGEHGLAGKWFMHEESIRLPLIIFDPRLKNKTVRKNEVVLNIDIAPTIFELAGLPVPSQVQGRSLMPLVNGETVKNWREDFLYEHRFLFKTLPPLEGLRTKRWKYTRYYNEKPIYEELFDLKTDPHEENNLAANSQHAERLKTMRSRTNTLIKEHSKKTP